MLSSTYSTVVRSFRGHCNLPFPFVFMASLKSRRVSLSLSKKKKITDICGLASDKSLD